MRVRPLLLAALLVVAACSDDGGEATTTTTASSSAEQDAADAAVAALEARLAADGFQPVPEDSAFGNDFAFTDECEEFSDALPTDGTPFSAHGVSAESGGYQLLAPEPQSAVMNTGGFAGVAGDEEIPFELEVEQLPALGLGDESVGVRMRGSIGGSPYPFIVEVHLVRSGRSGVGVFTTTFDDAAAIDRAALLEVMLDEVGEIGG